MPRLTTQQHIAAYDYLHSLWHRRKSVFRWLSSRDQRSLHDFYRPSELLLPQELISHREACTANDPSLPQRAGRALRHLKSIEAKLLAHEHETQQTALSTRTRRRVVQGVTAEQIRIRGFLHPRPDIKKLSSAIVALAHQQLMEEQSTTNTKRHRARRRSRDITSNEEKQD